MTLSSARRLKKYLRAIFSTPLHATLDRRQRNTECFCHLALRYGAIQDQLRREESKTGHVRNLVREHGQVPIEVDHLIVTTFEGQFRGDGCCTNRKNWQLELGHELKMEYFSLPAQERVAPKNRATIFPSPQIPHRPGQEF